jgi:hypothetical protein
MKKRNQFAFDPTKFESFRSILSSEQLGSRTQAINYRDTSNTQTG